jgi:hypothetical protein
LINALVAQRRNRRYEILIIGVVVVPVNKKKMESLPPEAIAYPVQDAVPVSGNNIGSHCRRCGKEFIPLPNLRGSAREYRCNKCLGLEALTADFAYSCAVQ